jgi:hypothetical protein
MTRNESPTVEFLCRAEDTDRAPDPVTAAHQFPRLLQQQTVPQNHAESAKKDKRTTDAVTHGWYLYPPETIAITKDSESNDSIVASGEEFVTENDSPLQSLWIGVVDSLWHVTIPEGYVLLVTNPAYRPNGPVTPQVLTSTDSPKKLDIPLATKGDVTLSESTPIVQVLPFSEDVLNTDDYVVGTHPPDVESQIHKRNSLEQIYDNAYEERIWNRKSSPGQVDSLE